jgi:ferredoxin-like protein FixX
MSDDKVIEIAQFRQKQPEWVIESTCTSQLFFLHYDGTVECRSCKRICETIEWRYRPGGEPAT